MPKQESIKSIILGFIRVAHMGGESWIAGGSIEKYLNGVRGTKGHTTTRRLQELASDGLLEANYDKGFVRYRLPLPQKTYQPKVANQMNLSL